MPAKDKKQILLGIDLGTTNTAAASIDDAGQPRPIKNAEGSYVTPSMICFDLNGEIIVGQEAKNLATAYPNSTIREIKRHMGKVDAEGESIAFYVHMDGRKWIPEELSALILKKIKNDAETITGLPVGGVVITVPTYFRDSERHATINAGKAAGLEVLDILDESTAAALYYQIDKAEDGKCYMVFDLGGGTFDVTIVKLEGGKVIAVGTDGERNLGGADWDMRIISRIKKEAAKHDISFDEITDSAIHQETKDKAERLKHSLSVRSEATFNQNIQGKQVTFTLTRQEFEADTQDLVERMTEKVRATLKEVRMSSSDIEETIMVGGATHMPMIEQLLINLMGKPPKKDTDPDLAVAQGAALAAALIANKRDLPFHTTGGKKIPKILPAKDFVNVAAHALGCAAFNADRTHKEFAPIIKKNTALPAKCTETFSLLDENQATAVVEVYQGQEGDPLEKCLYIGVVELNGLPAGDPTEERITVTYEYSMSGIVGVTVTDAKSGKSTNGEIKHKLGMKEKDIKKAKKKVNEKSA